MFIHSSALVLYGCGTWSLTLTEERRLRVSENSVLRRIFGKMTDSEKGQCRKVQKKLNDLYHSPYIVG